MELIVIYGAPGVGKLTVAKELAERTGYRLFHNHLTIDLVLSLFAFGTEQQTRLTSQFRLTMLEEAAKTGLPGIIFTLVYARGGDDEFVQQIIDAVEPHGGRVRFVLLTCETELLLGRVMDVSRAAYGKLRDRETVREMLDRHQLATPVPHRTSLEIDTTLAAPGDVADRIVRYNGNDGGLTVSTWTRYRTPCSPAPRCAGCRPEPECVLGGRGTGYRHRPKTGFHLG
ncbi:MAG: AAA family ATPase [Chloroflexota bacterium]|nr:AAA family ATPase [Chloroflexota bacterium]